MTLTSETNKKWGMGWGRGHLNTPPPTAMHDKFKKELIFKVPLVSVPVSSKCVVVSIST